MNPGIEYLGQVYSSLADYVPALTIAGIVAVLLWFTNWFLLKRRPGLGAEHKLMRQLLVLLLTASGLLFVILAWPVSEATRGQVLSLIGLVATGVIALSSTTFVANAMAGIMLRLVKSFRAGDFVRVGEQFGRVTERALFHTEMQTEDRDLTTFPNLYLITNPVTVVHASGTIISATLSLGYDIPHGHIESLLAEAAAEAELQEPFVQIIELGDFSVSYKISGFLSEVKGLLSARTNLKRKVLDKLHGNGIEIVSPNFMNQRVLPQDQRIIPEKPVVVPAREDKPEQAPESLMFDKADVAEQAEQLALTQEKLKVRVAELKGSADPSAGKERARLESEIEISAKRAEELNQASDEDLKPGESELQK